MCFRSKLLIQILTTCGKTEAVTHCSAVCLNTGQLFVPPDFSFDQLIFKHFLLCSKAALLLSTNLKYKCRFFTDRWLYQTPIDHPGPHHMQCVCTYIFVKCPMGLWRHATNFSACTFFTLLYFTICIYIYSRFVRIKKQCMCFLCMRVWSKPVISVITQL